MKYCENCGFQMFDRETRCPNCGQSDGKASKKRRYSTDVASISGILISLFIPIAGVIFWLMKRKDEPRAARTYLIIGLIMWLINFLILSSYMNNNGVYQNRYQTQNEYQYDASV